MAVSPPNRRPEWGGGGKSGIMPPPVGRFTAFYLALFEYVGGNGGAGAPLMLRYLSTNGSQMRWLTKLYSVRPEVSKGKRAH